MAAIAMPSVAPRYSRLMDIIAAAAGALTAGYAAYLVIGAMNAVSQINGMFGSLAGNNPYGRNIANAAGLGVSPGWGMAVWIAATALLIIQGVRAYRTASAVDV
ncbi:hypothetical protein D3C87_1915010 [compost metagenome]